MEYDEIYRFLSACRYFSLEIDIIKWMCIILTLRFMLLQSKMVLESSIAVFASEFWFSVTFEILMPS